MKYFLTAIAILTATSVQAYDVQVKEFQPTNSVVGYLEAQTECYSVFRGIGELDGMIYHNIRPWPYNAGALDYSFDLVYPAKEILKVVFKDPFLSIDSEIIEAKDAVYVDECLDSSEYRSLPRIFKISKKDIEKAQKVLDEKANALKNKSKNLINSFN